MSRVGKKPISIPASTKVSYKDRLLTIEGKKGKLSRQIHPAVDLALGDGTLQVVPASESRDTGALQGLTRSLVANMVAGVSQGFERVLEINGIGYRAELKGSLLVFHLGFSAPKEFELPAGISAAIEKNTVHEAPGALQGQGDQVRGRADPEKGRQDRHEVIEPSQRSAERPWA